MDFESTVQDIMDGQVTDVVQVLEVTEPGDNGILFARSVLNGDLVITPSALLPIVEINLGSV